MRSRHASRKKKKEADRDGQSEAALHCMCAHTCAHVFVCVCAISLHACVCVHLRVCFNSHSQRASVRRSANWPSYKYRGGCSQIGKKGNRLQSDTKLPSVTMLSIRQQLKSGKWNKNKEKQNTKQGENSGVIVLWRLVLLRSTRV